MALSARAVASAALDSSTSTLSLNDWLPSHIESALAVSQLQAFDFADEIQEQVRTQIDALIARAQTRGVMPPYVWADSARSTLAKPFLLSAHRDQGLEESASLFRPGIQKAIGSLTGSGFERVCSHLLSVYGVSTQQQLLTGGAGDGGLDFFAVLKPYARPGSDRLFTLGRRFIGQAKRAANGDVNNDVVEAFGSRLADIRAGIKQPKSMPPWFVAGSDPIIGLLMTGGYLGPTAREVARKYVIYTIEGDQIGEDLARSPIVAQWANDTGTDIDPVRFGEFFNNLANHQGI